MDWRKLKELCLENIRKHRYAVLVFLVGILLLLYPGPANKPEEPVQQSEPASTPSEELQEELESLLSRLEGAGKVRLLLTEACGEEITYQTDENIQSGDGRNDIQRDTVIITGENRAQQGLIQRRDPPVYMGAVVLCQGADSAAVRLAIVEAVKSATGLPANRISVLKMK